MLQGDVGAGGGGGAVLFESSGFAASAAAGGGCLFILIDSCALTALVYKSKAEIRKQDKTKIAKSAYFIRPALKANLFTANGRSLHVGNDRGGDYSCCVVVGLADARAQACVSRALDELAEVLKESCGVEALFFMDIR